MTYRTEAGVWRALAQAYARRTPDTRGPFGHTTGICLVLADLYDAGHITSALYNKCGRRLSLFLPDRKQKDAHWWTRDAAGRRGRILACCFLAAMAENRSK